ncbi:MAG: ABC transporter ATP-binding protein [Alphaproteobacteria bacterium]|jgi:putrescine transport system ATP-binding protein|nr:ABC transporter ATP-binding protein [Hyphomicrobiales bacterium]|tara:strand:- start:13024 stop:14145 length:1122 start_codon:yes stop_codon:yes gene_type:complete
MRDVENKSLSPCIRIRNLTKHFGNSIAVKNISLDIYKNEFFAILGPSGCGKTTLLRLIAGLEIQETGEIYISDTDYSSSPPNVRPVNMVFQSYALFPHMTVRKNIEFGLKIDGLNKKTIKTKVLDVLNMVKMNDHIDKYPSQLSGGEKQRVALARAITKNPDVILLDEPLSALDANLRREMQIELSNLQKSLGITFVLVTHDQDEALSIASRIAVMNEGEIVEVSTPDEIYESPKDIFSAKFIGKINILEGEIKKIDDTFVYETIDFGHINISANKNNPSSFAIGIRPEKISIGRTCSSKKDDLSVKGEIIEWNYYGNINYLVVKTSNNSDLYVHMQNKTKSSIKDLKKEPFIWLTFNVKDLMIIKKNTTQRT